MSSSPVSRPHTASSTHAVLSPAIKAGTLRTERPTTSPDHPSSLRNVPKWGEGAKIGQPEGAGMTPTSLYGARVQSPPNRFSRGNVDHASRRAQQSARLRSPYLAIRSPQQRTGTAGSANSLGSRGGTELVGTRSTTTTKEDLLQQRRDAWNSREQSKMRLEISRFQGAN